MTYVALPMMIGHYRSVELTGSEAKKMKEIFGVEALDAAGNLRPIVDVLDEVQQSMAGLESPIMVMTRSMAGAAGSRRTPEPP